MPYDLYYGCGKEGQTDVKAVYERLVFNLHCILRKKVSILYSVVKRNILGYSIIIAELWLNSKLNKQKSFEEEYISLLILDKAFKVL